MVTACSGAAGHDSAECAVQERRFQQPGENEMDPPISRIILGTALRRRAICSLYSLKFLEMWPVLGSRTWMCRRVAPAL